MRTRVCGKAKKQNMVFKFESGSDLADHPDENLSIHLENAGF